MMVALILMAAHKATAHKDWLMSYVKIMPPASLSSSHHSLLNSSVHLVMHFCCFSTFLLTMDHFSRWYGNSNNLEVAHRWPWKSPLLITISVFWGEVFEITLLLKEKKKIKTISPWFRHSGKALSSFYIVKEQRKVWGRSVFRDVFETKLRWMISEA